MISIEEEEMKPGWTTIYYRGEFIKVEPIVEGIAYRTNTATALRLKKIRSPEKEHIIPSKSWSIKRKTKRHYRKRL